MICLSLALLAACDPASVPSPAASATDADSAASIELRRLIEDVTRSTARRYGLQDDRGHEMDGLKILSVSEAGGFVGLYHSYRNDVFDVDLATSTDLMNWTWRAHLASHASMPTIRPALDGGYVVAWEEDPEPNHLVFAYYPDWADLLGARPAKTFEAPNDLSPCAEGTPNLYAASSTHVEVGFHFFDDCEVDRQARGETDWTSWIAAPRRDLEAAVRRQGVSGGVGDRDVLQFMGAELTLVEGMKTRDDWRTWRVFLYEGEPGMARQLEFRTDAGSVAFTNPTIDIIEIDGQSAVLVTLFVPMEGAKGGEAGELIYYRTYGPAK